MTVMNQIYILLIKNTQISTVNIYFILLLGKGESIWDRFVHRHGNIPREANGDVAADSYHKYAEDIKCIERLGVNMLVKVLNRS